MGAEASAGIVPGLNGLTFTVGPGQMEQAKKKIIPEQLYFILLQVQKNRQTA